MQNTSGTNYTLYVLVVKMGNVQFNWNAISFSMCDLYVTFALMQQ